MLVDVAWFVIAQWTVPWCEMDMGLRWWCCCDAMLLSRVEIVVVAVAVALSFLL